MTVYQIMQEEPQETLMTVRTKSGMLKGWYFPVINGTVACRFFPTVYDDAEHHDFSTEALAVQWITER